MRRIFTQRRIDSLSIRSTGSLPGETLRREIQMAQGWLTNRRYLAIGAAVVVVVIAAVVYLNGGSDAPSTADQPKTDTPGATSPAPTNPPAGTTK